MGPDLPVGPGGLGAGGDLDCLPFLGSVLFFGTTGGGVLELELTVD